MDTGRAFVSAAINGTRAELERYWNNGESQIRSEPQKGPALQALSR
jgi:hypothetical protein